MPGSNSEPVLYAQPRRCVCVCVCVRYLQVQVVQVPQQSEVLSTNLTNHIVLEEDGLGGEKTQ